MNSIAKRTAASVSAFVAVGAIVLGAFGVASAMPEPTPTVTPANLERPAEDFADRLDYSPAAEEAIAEREAEAAAAEAARVEAERVAAEQAAAAQAEADRLAAEEAARQAQQNAPRQSTNTGGSASQPVAPAPAPVVEEPAPSGGDQQAGECREYNEANECTAVYVP